MGVPELPPCDSRMTLVLCTVKPGRNGLRRDALFLGHRFRMSFYCIQNNLLRIRVPLQYAPTRGGEWSTWEKTMYFPILP